MQKELSTDTYSNNSQTINSYEGLSPEFIMQAQVGMCPTLTLLHNHSASTDWEPAQPTPPTDEAYAELPIDNATTQDKSQDDENPANQPETQDDFQDAPQNNSPATQSKGWASTLVSVPAKIVSAFNPLNWLSNKNSAASQQQKVIIETKEEDSYEKNDSASLNEGENPLEQAQNFLSAFDELTPDDSEFKDATSTDSPLTGNDSNLLDNN